MGPDDLHEYLEKVTPAHRGPTYTHWLLRMAFIVYM